ncbi:MAG: FAD-binding oxidoreductase [Bryobacteraceae bacterium]|nr:FAD-binding oxidoreductase [Bryobacteraceae bacterium]
MVQLVDASGYTGVADRLFIPRDEAELISELRAVHQQKIPVTIVGARTGLAGGAMPNGGWAVSLERFQICIVERGSAVVGAGTTLRDLQRAAAQTRQIYGPDPTENSSSLGGNIATNASGSRSFRYGDTRRSVLRLRVVLLDGTILDLNRGEPTPFPIPALPRPETTKFSAGFDLHPGMDYVDLFIGSEGVLGVITQATVRLLPMPDGLLSGVVFFRREDEALAAVEQWRDAAGLTMLEYMDGPSLALLRSRDFDVAPAAGACLLIELEIDKDSDAASDWLDRIEAAGALVDESWFGVSLADRERFRVFRHALPEAVNDLVRRRGFQKMGTDFAVPLRHNAGMMTFYREELKHEFPDDAVIFGHIGDAHVHVNLLPRTAQDVERGRSLIRRFAERVVALGGTVAAEHGLGKRKRDLLAYQWTPDQLEAMRAIKTRFDPHWQLGRGTLFAE